MEQFVTASSLRSYQGGYFRTLVAPIQTAGALALIEFTLSKGGEPPPHVHANEDEMFYVVNGEIEVAVAGKPTTLKPGEALFAPRNVPHFFKILSEKATLLNLISPGTLWNYFIEFSEPITEIPQTVSAPGMPQKEHLERMLDVITHTYKVSFYTPQ